MGRRVGCERVALTLHWNLGCLVITAAIGRGAPIRQGDQGVPVDAARLSGQELYSRRKGGLHGGAGRWAGLPEPPGGRLASAASAPAGLERRRRLQGGSPAWG